METHKTKRERAVRAAKFAKTAVDITPVRGWNKHLEEKNKKK